MFESKIGDVRTLIVDLTFAVRAARKNLPVTLLIVTSLAIAIGFNAAVFSVFHGVFLSDLPFAHADRRGESRGAPVLPPPPYT